MRQFFHTIRFQKHTTIECEGIVPQDNFRKVYFSVWSENAVKAHITRNQNPLTPSKRNEYLILKTLLVNTTLHYIGLESRISTHCWACCVDKMSPVVGSNFVISGFYRVAKLSDCQC